MDGWIKLHRKILSSRVWRGADADGKVILLTFGAARMPMAR